MISVRFGEFSYFRYQAENDAATKALLLGDMAAAIEHTANVIKHLEEIYLHDLHPLLLTKKMTYCDLLFRVKDPSARRELESLAASQVVLFGERSMLVQAAKARILNAES